VVTAAARTRTPSAQHVFVIVAEPLEACVEGYVIDQWRNPEAIKIARSDDERMARIRGVTDEMRHLQEQNEALRMKLREEVRYIGMDVHREFAQLAVVEDGLVRDEGRIGVTPEALRRCAADLSPDDEVALEALRMKLRGEVAAKTFQEVTAGVDAAHDQLAREHNRLASEAGHVGAIRAIPYQDLRREAERLRAVHEARVKIVPRV
jgi:hypothetical protein